MGAPREEPRPRDRGGDDVPTARPPGSPRVALAAAAVGLATLAGLVTAFDTETVGASLVAATAAILLLAVGLLSRWSPAIALAIVVLGALYAIPSGDRAIPAVVYGAALLLVAELAYWSLDEHLRQRIEPGALTPRLVATLAIAGAAIPAGALVLAAADAGVSRSAAVTALGAAALVGCVALLTSLASR